MSAEGKVSTDNVVVAKVDAVRTLNGKNAYEMAVLHGYTGTFEDWIASIKSGRLTDGHREAIANLVIEKNGLAIENEKNARIEADNFILEALGLDEVSETAYRDYCLEAVNRIDETLGFVQPDFTHSFGRRKWVENGELQEVTADVNSTTYTYDFTPYRGCKLLCRSTDTWTSNDYYGYALYNDFGNEIIVCGNATTVLQSEIVGDAVVATYLTGYDFIIDVPSNAGNFVISFHPDSGIKFDVESIFDISRNVYSLMKKVPMVDQQVIQGSTSPISSNAVYEYGEEIKNEINASINSSTKGAKDYARTYTDDEIKNVYNYVGEQLGVSEKVYTSSDFIQGLRVVGTGLVAEGNDSLYRIVVANMPEVKAGDKVYVTPAEGFKVDIAVTDTDDYASVTSYLQHTGFKTEYFECEITSDGYLNIDIASTVGAKVSPSDYACDVSVVTPGIAERMNDTEAHLDELESRLSTIDSSVETNAVNINTLTEQVQEMLPEKNYTSADFTQGYREIGKGLVLVGDNNEHLYAIVNTYMPKVKVGDKIYVTPAENTRVDIAVTDTDDYANVTSYLQHTGFKTAYFECEITSEGYLNIDIRSTVGAKILPSDYACDITVVLDNTKERLSDVENQLKSAETLSPKSKLPTTIVNDCQDVTEWSITNKSVTAVDETDHIMWEHSLHCDGEMRCTKNIYDLLNNDLVIKLRINSIETGSSIVLRLGNTADSSVGATYELMRGATTTPTGEWRDITVPYTAFKQQSSGVDFGAVNDIYIYADNLSTSGVDGVADWNIQYIGTRPRKLNKGIVSFTFDDGYESQYTGIKLLAEKGISSTLYHVMEATGQTGQDKILSIEELQELVNYYGADIEVHGDVYENEAGDRGYNALSDDELIKHWSNSQRFLRENGLSEGMHMSYPGSYHSNRVVQLAKKFFESCRTIQYYIPCETYPPADNYRLRAVSSISASANTVETIKRYIDMAKASGSWLILTFHRIGDVPAGQEANASMYCSESDLQAIADYAIESGATIKNIAEVYNTTSSGLFYGAFATFDERLAELEELVGGIENGSY